MILVQNNLVFSFNHTGYMEQTEFKNCGSYHRFAELAAVMQQLSLLKIFHHISPSLKIYRGNNFF